MIRKRKASVVYLRMLMHFANVCPAHPLPDASGFCIPLPVPEPAYSVATVVSGAGVPLGQADKQMETPELLFDHLLKKKSLQLPLAAPSLGEFMLRATESFLLYSKQLLK